MTIDELFNPTNSLLEIFVRGSIVYLFLFFVFRILRREGGEIGISDLLLVVLIADAVQNAMANHYRSVTEGFVLVITITAWDYLINWLSFHFRWFAKLIEPPPLVLIRNGKVNKKNMAKELITMDELLSQLRLQGAEGVDKIKWCHLEADGKISVQKFTD